MGSRERERGKEERVCCSCQPTLRILSIRLAQTDQTHLEFFATYLFPSKLLQAGRLDGGPQWTWGGARFQGLQHVASKKKKKITTETAEAANRRLHPQGQQVRNPLTSRPFLNLDTPPGM